MGAGRRVFQSKAVLLSLRFWLGFAQLLDCFFCAFPLWGVFHDSLLAVGAYQVGNYFRDKYRDQLMGSGDGYPRVMIQGQERDCLQLKLGDDFMLKDYSKDKKCFFPFPIAAREFSGSVISDGSESWREYNNASVTIPAHTFFTYSKGTLKVQESPVQPNRAKKKSRRIFCFYYDGFTGIGSLCCLAKCFCIGGIFAVCN